MVVKRTTIRKAKPKVAKPQAATPTLAVPRLYTAWARERRLTPGIFVALLGVVGDLEIRIAKLEGRETQR